MICSPLLEYERKEEINKESHAAEMKEMNEKVKEKVSPLVHHE